MTPADLIRAFETLADAPDGVARLRELVLQLAVRGKLVPQDPSDEPASELLKRIAAEKARLVKAGEIMKDKELPAIAAVDVPFHVPRGWAWTRLLWACILFQDCPHKTPTYDPTGKYLAIRPRDVVGGQLNAARAQRVGRAAFEVQNAKHVPVAGDIAYSRELSLGWAAVIPADVPICLSQGMVVMRPHPIVDTGYFVTLMNAPVVRGQAMAKALGAAHLHLNVRDIRALLLPIPPAAEQRRIVAKIDSLMGLLARLEAARSSRDNTRAAMCDAALSALRDADDAEAVELAWARVAERMDDLFTEPADVAPLRQTILQLAVRGKLVPQGPSDEPASELLKRIAAEKARLVEAGEIKESKPLLAVAPDEMPFELPKSWAWASLETMSARVTDGDHQPPPKARSGVPFLVIGNLSSGEIDLTGARFVPQGYYDALDWTRQPSAGDVLYTVTGSFGIAVVVGNVGPFCVQRHVAILKKLPSWSSEYLCIALRSPAAVAYAAKNATGTAQKTVSLSTLRRLLVPVPPLAEQRRIVAKVDSLFSLCDQLEQRLEVTRSAQVAFAGAAVHHLEN